MVVRVHFSVSEIVSCPSDAFFCDAHALCIAPDRKCDGTFDCDDRSDELFCSSGKSIDTHYMHER